MYDITCVSQNKELKRSWMQEKSKYCSDKEIQQCNNTKWQLYIAVDQYLAQQKLLLTEDGNEQRAPQVDNVQ